MQSRSTPRSGSNDYSLAPDVIPIHTPDGSLRLIDLNGRTHAVSPAGAWLLQGVIRSNVPDTIAAAVSRFEVPRDVIEADLENLIGRLVDLRVLQWGPNRSTRKTPLALRLAVQAGGLVARIPCSLAVRVWLMLALAAVSIRVSGWTTTVALFRRLAALKPPHRFAGSQAIDAAVRRIAAAHPLRLQCKERGLVCWALAGQAGLEATLVIGFRHYPFEGHCWCLVDGQVVSDFPDRCAGFTPTVTYQHERVSTEVRRARGGSAGTC